MWQWFKRLTLLATIIAILGMIWLSVAMGRFNQQKLADDVLSFEVPKGITMPRLVPRLIEQTDINPGYAWLVLSHKHNLYRKLKAGEYELDAGMTALQVLETITDASKTKQYKVRIAEGKMLNSVLINLRDADENSVTGLKELRDLDDADDSNLLELLGLTTQLNGKDSALLVAAQKNQSAEGLLMPDTYFYSRGDGVKRLLIRAIEAMQKHMDTAWPLRMPNPHIKTPYQALILASIVEMESGHPDDRKKIAQVFLNRLKIGMKLQTDPTVIYGVRARYRGNITKAHLADVNDYNTYVIDGLPPTPIALPSRESIDAVFHPEATSALYFVAKGGGRSHFSDSYREHRAAVVKYLLNGNKKAYRGDD